MSENFLVAFYGFLTIENIFTVDIRQSCDHDYYF